MIDERCRTCDYLVIPYAFCKRNGHDIDYDKSDGTCILNKSIYRHGIGFNGYCYPDFCEKGSKEYSYPKTICTTYKLTRQEEDGLEKKT